MNKWMTAIFTAVVLTLVPSNAFASVNGWNDAEPMFITVLTILSVITIFVFIYLMLRDNG
ncbi:hypothetical protein [Alteribacillus bidgolensis]|uniref:Uncharacterized protein n=1 Tax=Alteribacillus bidgolensis TaxID=930129 RepID=A0A1G8CBI0_9BACI|nr:hypothetical protein [Alteribacillus bidgolensis]SDH42593.1 hypothetical protein SAMN05216352_101252 [Alteribacillus bidgolensis]